MNVIASYPTLAGPFKAVYPEMEIWRNQKEADLVIFTGGEDIDPGIYQERSNGTYGVNQERDKRELSLLNRILEGTFVVGKVLGVCRGLQLISAVLGMKLIQDIHAEGLTHQSEHSIHWEYPTIFSELTTVNSLHHQMVGSKYWTFFRDGYEPTVLARETQVGYSEAILWGSNILGVQFHPEFFVDEKRRFFFDRLNEWIKGGEIIGQRKRVPEKKIREKYEHLPGHDLPRGMNLNWDLSRENGTVTFTVPTETFTATFSDTSTDEDIERRI